MTAALSTLLRYMRLDREAAEPRLVDELLWDFKAVVAEIAFDDDLPKELRMKAKHLLMAFGDEIN